MMYMHCDHVDLMTNVPDIMGVAVEATETTTG